MAPCRRAQNANKAKNPVIGTEPKAAATANHKANATENQAENRAANPADLEASPAANPVVNQVASQAAKNPAIVAVGLRVRAASPLNASVLTSYC